MVLPWQFRANPKTQMNSIAHRTHLDRLLCPKAPYFVFSRDFKFSGKLGNAQKPAPVYPLFPLWDPYSLLTPDNPPWRAAVLFTMLSLSLWGSPVCHSGKHLSSARCMYSGTVKACMASQPCIQGTAPRWKMGRKTNLQTKGRTAQQTETTLACDPNQDPRSL